MRNLPPPHQKINLIALIILFVFSNSLKAQFTAASQYQEQTWTYCNNGYITSVLNTGNDARSDDGSGLYDMKVNVWDGENPGLGWEYGPGAGNSISICHMSLPSNIIDPDVVLYEGRGIQQSSSTTWFAIVVYADISTNYCYCDIFEYDLANNTYATSGYSSHSLISRINPHNDGRWSAINIDVDADGNYSIVWDDYYLHHGIYLTSGSGSTPPGVAYNPVINVGIMPDVALLQFPNNNESTYITFVDPGQNPNLCVYESVNGGSFYYSYHNYNSYLFSINDTYLHPRIACPPYTICGKEWTIVFENNTTNDVDGVTMFCSDAQTNVCYGHIYTNGGTDSPSNINGDRNQLPALSYDNQNGQYPTIMIGWQSDYLSNLNSTPTCFALNCYLDGSLQTCAFLANYMIVPTNLHGNENTLSIAGRYYRNMFYTYFDYSFSDIMFKEVQSCSASLRIRGYIKGDNNFNNNLEFVPNPFTDELKIINSTTTNDEMTIRIDDINGKNIYLFSGTENEINNSLKGEVSKFTNGVYVVKIKSEDVGTIIIKKIIKL